MTNFLYSHIFNAAYRPSVEPVTSLTHSTDGRYAAKDGFKLPRVRGHWWAVAGERALLVADFGIDL